jgi:hypothetical protein
MLTTLFVLIFTGSTVIVARELKSNPKVKEYSLDVSFKPEKAFMKGKAVVKFESAVKTDAPLIFYLHGELTVEQITYKNKKVQFEQKRGYYYDDYSLIANRVSIHLDQLDANHEITIDYSGYFNPSKARSPSDYMRITKNEVLLRSYGYSLWFPVFLHDGQDSYKVDFKKVTLQTPKYLISVFVGSKLNEYVEGDTRITQWTALNTEIRDVQCTAREYTVLSAGDNHIYHLNNDVSKKIAGEIMALFKQLVTLYKKYYKETRDNAPFYLLEMPEYGNISSGNVHGMSTEAWTDFAKYTWTKRLLAHELVHPFVQLTIKRANPLYALVIEGFPSYFHLPVLETILGKKWYDDRMQKIENWYLEKKKTGKHPRGWKLPAEKAILDLTADDIGEYKDLFILNDRVVLFFNYLKKKMANENFWKFSKELVNLKSIDYIKLEQLILKYLPDSKDDIETWLKKNDYPHRFHLIH